MRPIQVSAEKISLPRDWQFGARAGRSVSWTTSVRNRVAATKMPQFVLRADGSGTLFFWDLGKVHQKTWPKVQVINRPSFSPQS